MKRKRIILILEALLVFSSLWGCNKPEKEEIKSGKGECVTLTVQPVLTKNPEDVPASESTKEPEKAEQSQKLTFSFREETDEAKEEDTIYFTSNLYFPFFEGDRSEEINSFVYSVTTRFREYLPGAKERALLDFHDYTGQDYFRFPEVEEFTVNITMENETLLSFFTQWYSDAGGVHPNHYCEGYTIKKENAEELTIEEFLSGYGISKEELAACVAEQMCTENGMNLEEFMFVESLPDAVLGFLDDHQWYLTEDELVVFANTYDIAPYAYGLIAGKISFENLGKH